MIIFLIAWLVLIFYKIKIDSNSVPNPFNKENSVILRGMAALEIMIGHIGLATGSKILFPNRKAGILFVGIFLALSGYGLMYSKENKKQYMDEFLGKRLCKLLIPAYSVYIIFVIFQMVQSKNIIYLRNIIDMKHFFLNTNWYVWEIILLYCIFYTAYKISVDRMSTLILGASVIFILIAFILKIPDPWYGSTICFWLGVVYYKHQSNIENKILENYILFLFGSVVILGFSILLFFILNENNIVGNVFARNIAAGSFICMLIAILYKVKIGNIILYWCGIHSYEIYLFHILYIAVIRQYIKNSILFGVCIVIVTILSAFCYSKIEKNLKLYFKKEKREQSEE